MSQLYWGIDLGGTKVEGVVFEGDAIHRPLCRLRLPTEAHKGYPHILGQIERLLANMTEATGLKPEHLGLGGPGAIMPGSGKMMNANTTCLNGQPMREDLTALLGIPVKMANDANCFALAESLYGAGQGERVVFGSITGTGVGGGLVFDGKVWPGHQGIAGEWGHNMLEPGGDLCYCGRRGCAETVCSGPSLERHYERLAGHRKPLKEIVDTAAQDVHAAATLERLDTMFGLLVAQLVNVLDPDVIVLGGGVGRVPGLAERAAAEANKSIFQPQPKVRLALPQLGDSAGVFGAALLWREEE